MMPQTALPFQYEAEKNNSVLTGFAGLPLYIELAIRSGFVKKLNETMKIKKRGWTDAEVILSLILLNLAGGDCINDIERLEKDAALRTLLVKFAVHGMTRQERRAYEKRWRKTKARGLPSNAAMHRYLPEFHSREEEEKRVSGEAFIPKPNAHLEALFALNAPLIAAAQQHCPSTIATLDQDATLAPTYKRNALYCYKGYKAYQPFNTYWAEQGMLLHSEFRDGNVNGGFEQRRLFKKALSLLPPSVTDVYLRSDSAGYQEELLLYCGEGHDERFGVIGFAVAARVTQGMKEAAVALAPSDWAPLYQQQPDGSFLQTDQEWADVCFVPDWVVGTQGTYRYLVIRESMKALKKPVEELALPFQTIETGQNTYKLFAIVTNQERDGNDVIQWHRQRCGKSEQAHHTQKEELAGGHFPSNLFGVNAAWWQIMVLAFNLQRLMQLVALPSSLKESNMKALRWQVIQLPGRIITHARQITLRVEAHCYELFQTIRSQIVNTFSNIEYKFNTS